MLSLKTILAKSDKLPLLIFDEIDTGVSGRIAQKVGAALKDLASFHQIISITHLPQIAGMANNHFAVEKKQVDAENLLQSIEVYQKAAPDLTIILYADRTIAIENVIELTDIANKLKVKLVLATKTKK